MKKFFFIALLIMVGTFFGWAQLPQRIREKTAAFVGIALRRDKEEMRTFIEEKILPQNPETRRTELIQKLEDNVKEIKQRTLPSLPQKEEVPAEPHAQQSLPQKQNISPVLSKKQPSREKQDMTIGELIASSEKLLQELETANKNKSVDEELTTRLIDKILPSDQKQEDVCTTTATK